MPEPATPFPESALELLELPVVLQWIAGAAATPAGRRALAEARPAAGGQAFWQRRWRGLEAWKATAAGAAPGLARCADLRELLAAAGKRVLDALELSSLAETLGRFAELELWGSQHPEYPELRACTGALRGFEELRARLREVLDERGKVRDEADPGLARIREHVRGLAARREKLLEEIGDDWHRRGWLRSAGPVQRGGRLLLALRAHMASRGVGVLHDRSQSGDTVFVEPAKVVALSNAMDDELVRERNLVHRILSELTKSVLERRTALEQAEARLAELDYALAAAAWGREVGAVFPDMADFTPGAGLELRAARHPLLQRELGRDKVVPLDLAVGDAYDLLVVTGPNTGGKTVALKTLGLLAALACCGFPVTAAAGSRVPALAGLEADIGDPQSIQSSLSTFSGHVRRILGVLERARPGTLVLLDELGTGTDPEEGAALGQAILETLLARGALVLATTHLGALKVFSLRVPRAENASMEFDPATLAPSYRLLVGVPGASHALEVAEHLGMPAEVLARAHSLSRRDGRSEAIIAEAAALRRDAELLREQARHSESAARAAQQRIADEEAAAQARRELREQEAEMAYRELQAELETLFHGDGARLAERLRGTDREQAEALLQRARAILAASTLSARWAAFLKTVKKGDVVYVPRYRQRLKVLRLDKKQGWVKVQSGDYVVEVPLWEITWVAPPA